jgi:hypothetical protein
VSRFERGDSTRTPAKDAEGRAAGSARATPRGVPKARAADQRSILAFVTPRKDESLSAPLSAKGKQPAAFETPPATPAESPLATPASVTVATPLDMLTGSSSASLQASGIPPPKTARRKILDDVHFGVHLDDGSRETAFQSIGVGVVDLTTPGSDPGESRKAPAASPRTTPYSSPLASPTKRARQAGIKAFMTPSKKAATAAAGTPAAEVVDLVDSDDTP